MSSSGDEGQFMLNDPSKDSLNSVDFRTCYVFCEIGIAHLMNDDLLEEPLLDGRRLSRHQ